MSIPKTTLQPTKPAFTKPPKRTITESEREELKLLDAACDRLKRVIPEKPYHLAIPVDKRFEFNHWTERERHAWREGTFFEPHEEYRQYLTLHHREHGETLIETRTEVDEERERRQRLGINGSTSGPGTPLVRPSGLPKKKINFSDYKAKLANGKAGAGAAPLKKIPEVAKAPAPMNDVKMEQAAPPSEQIKAPQGLKRPLDDAVKAPEAVEAAKATAPAEEPPTKKARALSPVKQTPPKKAAGVSTTHGTSHGTPHGLPPIISPIRGEVPPHGLPAMLSPGLPAAIEDELSRMSDHPDTQPGTPTSSEKPAPPKQQNHGDPVANKIANSLKKSGDAMKRIADLSDRQAQHEAEQEKNKEKTSDTQAPSASETDPPKRRQRYIVKLKYGKKNRKVVEAILKLPSKNARQADARARSESAAPKLDKAAAQEKPRVDAAPNNAVQKRDVVTSAAIKESDNALANKRKLQDDEPHDRLDVKRPRASSAMGPERRPTTPVQASAKSPSLLSTKPSAQKPNNHLTVTPRKDLQATKMQRSVSMDSSTVKTPQQAGSTPRTQPTSVPNGTATGLEKWSSLGRKYNDLGRKLKHDRKAINDSASATSNDRKRSAVLALQCLMAYMLSFHCGDTTSRLQRRPRSLDSSWLTMLALWREFRAVCQAYPHLEGLRNYLGLAVFNAITLTTVDRITLANKAGGDASDPGATSRSGASTSEAPTPTPSSGGGSNAAASGVPSLARIGEHSIGLATSARDAARLLSVREIMRAFPDTWAAAEEDDGARPAVGAYEKDPGELLGGKFWLPVCADTTPIQAVRFGLRLLKEWIAKEKLNVEIFIK